MNEEKTPSQDTPPPDAAPDTLPSSSDAQKAASETTGQARPSSAAEPGVASKAAEKPPSGAGKKPVRTGASSGRRTFLERCLGVLGAIGALGASYPVIRYLEPPPEAEGANRVEVDLTELPPGKGKLVIFRGRPALVVNSGEGFIAYTAVCPHLGCIVKWDELNQEFRCPCHGGRFNQRGEVLGGPVPGPLTAIAVSTSGDKVIVGA